MKLEVRNLNTFFEDTQILKNVNMDVPENSVTALIGPSGCGKSTFIRTVNRMNDLIPTFSHDGNISLDGVDVYDDAVDVVDLRKKVGMVFQKPNPFPKSIFDNVAYGLRIHGEEDEDYIAQVVEASLKSAAIWDEVKDKLDKDNFIQYRADVVRGRLAATEPETQVPHIAGGQIPTLGQGELGNFH